MEVVCYNYKEVVVRFFKVNCDLNWWEFKIGDIVLYIAIKWNYIDVVGLFLKVGSWYDIYNY